jgi:hypothetical protein
VSNEIPVAVVSMPLQPAERIEEALELLPSSYNYNPPAITLQGDVIIGRIPQPTADSVGAWKGAVKLWLEWRNDDIRRYSPQFRTTALQLIAARKQRVKEERSQFDDIAKTIGIPLRRKEGAPGAAVKLTTRRAIAVKRTPPTAKRPEEYGLSSVDLDGVIDEVVRICQQFEVAPSAYTTME